MGKGNWLNKEREFDRHAGEIDRSIKRNKGKVKEDPDSLEAQMKRLERQLEAKFEDIYPRFSHWEIKFNEVTNWSVGRLCQELRDYYGYNSHPQAAMQYIRSYWEREITPRDAWREIKDKILGW